MKKNFSVIGLAVCSLGIGFNIFTQDFMGLCIFALIGLTVYLKSFKSRSSA